MTTETGKGSTFPWYSSYGSDFNFDFHVTLDKTVAPVEYNYRSLAEWEELGAGWMGEGSTEQPGLSMFLRDGDEVFHTYSAYARGLDPIWGMWQWFDRAPLGRNEGDFSWFHRHDEYPTNVSARS